MSAPVFFVEVVSGTEDLIELSEESSRHIVQVLRMKPGETLQLTNGKGLIITADIQVDHKKKCVVKVQKVRQDPPPERTISIAISLIKNAHRFEWFLEKATEIGVSHIIPLLCGRTEKQHFRLDRMKSILVSAMLQSQQVWLPELSPPLALNDLIKQASQSQKFIAHCMEGQKISLADAVNPATQSQIILIGPEGDFTKEETELAMEYHFLPVSLGQTRLRTETAGVVASVLLRSS